MDKIIETVAGLMALSARTAPKAVGQDYLEIKVLTGSELNSLAGEMQKYGEETGRPNFDRDGDNVRRSQAVLLLSLYKAKYLGTNCGACGFASCAENEAKRSEGLEFEGPICAWRLLDLGIALGSAVKTASLLNADNRIMYRIGVAARRMKLIDGEIVVGIPLSAGGKSIYFDR